MNTPIRRLSTIMLLLLSAVFVSSTWIQFVRAGAMKDKPTNTRAILKEKRLERQPIIVANGTAVAQSSPVDDDTYRFQRSYPGKDVYAAVTGYYSVTQAGGNSTAIEATESSMLTGTADRLFYRKLQDVIAGIPPQGATVKLTIDPVIQQAAWDALGDQRGAVVAIEPSSGKIVAMVTKPSFDPNLLATHDAKKAKTAYQELLKANGNRLSNRASAERYPPGSTFKVITAAAALEDGMDAHSLTLQGPTSIPLPQTSNATITNDWGGPCNSYDGGSTGGNISLTDALRQSCNTAFATLGIELGNDKLATMARNFGFGEKLSIPFATSASNYPEQNNQPHLAQSAIGQYDVSATPLQIAMVSATIANDGVRMKPYLVDEYIAANKSVIARTQREILNQPVSATTAQALRDMMIAAVSGPGSTGGRASSDRFQVAGKTGTAQHDETINGKTKKNPPHAWFTGFAPAGPGVNPEIAVAVFVEDGGKLGGAAHGGTVAAPIAKKIFEAAVKP